MPKHTGPWLITAGLTQSPLSDGCGVTRLLLVLFVNSPRQNRPVLDLGDTSRARLRRARLSTARVPSLSSSWISQEGSRDPLQMV